YGVRVERQRVTISAPASVPLRTAVRLVPGGLRPTETRRGGDVELTFDVGPMEPVEPEPPGLPPDRPARPEIAFSTGASWSAVAAGYAKLVDPQRAPDATLKAAARDALAPAAAASKTATPAKPAARPAGGASGDDARTETIVRLVDRMQRDVRYTGVELGDA